MNTSVVPHAPAQCSPAERWLHIPAEMRERPQWVLAAPDDKAPRRADGGLASPAAPTTWTDFATACAAAAKRGWGIGYMLHQDDPFCCIDLDVKPDTAPDDRARFESIIATMDSYTERSRSGLGWHVWVKAGIGTGRRRDGVEVYSQERFMICTGDVVHPVPIAERQNVIDSMISQMARPAPEIDLTGPDTPDLAAAARAEADKGEMGRLWQGDWRGRYDSKSEADLALVKFLLPLTASPRESWATFRLSALGQRDKAARADYARRTIAVATQHLERDAYHIRHGRKVWEALCRNMKGGPVALRPVGSRLRLLRDNDLDALPPLRWLVKGVIPDAGIGAIYGASGSSACRYRHRTRCTFCCGKPLLHSPALPMSFSAGEYRGEGDRLSNLWITDGKCRRPRGTPTRLTISL